MTDNQEKELFTTLAALVTGVNAIQVDVKDLKFDVQEIKVTLDEHSKMLNEHLMILKEHSRVLIRLDAKTDSIAETVMISDRRLTKAERDIVELQSRIH